MYAPSHGHHETIKCPACGHPHLRTRFDGPIVCDKCGITFKFSRRSQRLLVVAVLLVPVLFAMAFIAVSVAGNIAGLIVGVIGALTVMGVLVYQGTVPQAERISDI